MTQDSGAPSLQIQQLVELLAVVSTLRDEAAAVRGAVERAAQAMEAEVAAVVMDGRVSASVGYPVGAVPEDDLVAVARRERDRLDVPGMGECHAMSAGWAGTHPGQLVVGRCGEAFTIDERSLVRGMARVLELTLTMLRTLGAEHFMRQRSDRQAAENAQLLASLRQRQRLLEHLFDIQRSISRRLPLKQILDAITAAAQSLLGDEVVGLWLRDEHDPNLVKLKSFVGLRPHLAKRLPAVALADAGVAGEAIATDSVRVQAYPVPVIDRLTDGKLRACMAAPVHASGQVTGSLLLAAYRPDREYTDADVQTLRAFAGHVSIALTDAKTVDRMYQAFHDSLTGLASRGLFLDRLTQALADADRDASRVALLFVDLDRFKPVNDTMGHAAGDELLMATAERLKSQIRAGDLAARLGGDEFAIMLCGLTGTAAAVAVAERVVAALGEPMAVAQSRLRVNASVGIALSQPGRPDTADLIRRADIAMYHAKRRGGARYELFVDGMQHALADTTDG